MPRDDLPLRTVGPYLPALLVETLREGGDGRPIRIDPVDGTTLFADVSGFTALSERLAQQGKEGAEILTSIINAYFEQMLGIARAQGGDNLKFGGDALLLLFRGEGHAARATGAALEMMRATHRFAAIRFGREHVKLSMSAGVHTGRFWAAMVGMPRSRMQHCLLGDDSARLAEAEGAASKGEVMVTATTWAEIEASFTAEPHGEFFHVRRATRRLPAIEAPQPPSERATVPASAAPYLPPPVVEAARAGEVRQPDGEHRKVTTMFISVRGANAILREGRPEEALEEVDRYVRAVVGLAERHGGYLVSNDVDSHGLKLILIFGAPVALEHPTEDALRLALGIVREREGMGLRLEHRIGINSGFVFCGDLGAGFRRDYTVLGDAVNLSARLMSAAANGQVLVSEATFREAESGFATRELEPIRVKGKSAPIEIRALLDEAPDAVRAPAAQAPLVGREDELASLREAWRAATRGSPAVALVTGEPGTGKSRLIAEIEQSVLSEGGLSIRGYCYAHMASAPYEPWISVLTQLFGVPPGADAAARTAAVGAILAEIGPAALDSASLLNTLLGLTFPQSAILASLDERTRRDRLHALVASIIAHRSAESPLILIIEDLHWADDASVQLLESVVARLRDTPTFLCLAARNTTNRAISLPAFAIRIELAELSAEASLALLNNLTGDGAMTGEAASDLLAKCRGNPLFLEEVGRALGADAVGGLAVPDRLQSLLMARIDSLPPAARRALKLAAVIGPTFEEDVLGALASRVNDGFNVPLALEELTRASVVLPEAGARPQFRFRHNLLQEVAYESLLFARRRELHRHVGETIEGQHAAQLEPYYETLVHHFEQSADLPKAVEYGVLAGDKARRVFASESAMAFYDVALDAARRAGSEWLAARSLIEERVGDSLEVIGRHADAAAAHRRALRAWRPGVRHREDLRAPFVLTRKDVPGREASLRTKVAVALERASDYAGSLRWLEGALADLPAHSPALEARIRGARSAAHSRKGENELAITESEAALAAARRSGKTEPVAYAHQAAANAYYETGQFRASLRHRIAALRLFESLGDLSRILVSQGNLGLSYMEVGEMDLAIQHHEACLATGRRLGNMTSIAITSNNLGEALLIQGRVAEAKEQFQRTIDTYRERGDPLAAAGLALVNLSRAHLLDGELEAADAALSEGTAMLRSAGARGLLVQSRAQRAELTLAQGDLEGAARHATRALADARELGAQLVEVKAGRVLGCVAALRANIDDAESLLQQAAEMAARLEAEYELGLCLLETARIRATANRPHAARPAARAARIFRRLGAESLALDAERLQHRAR